LPSAIRSKQKAACANAIARRQSALGKIDGGGVELKRKLFFGVVIENSAGYPNPSHPTGRARPVLHPLPPRTQLQPSWVGAAATPHLGYLTEYAAILQGAYARISFFFYSREKILRDMRSLVVV